MEIDEEPRGKLSLNNKMINLKIQKSQRHSSKKNQNKLSTSDQDDFGSPSPGKNMPNDTLIN